MLPLLPLLLLLLLPGPNDATSFGTFLSADVGDGVYGRRFKRVVMRELQEREAELGVRNSRAVMNCRARRSCASSAALECHILNKQERQCVLGV